MNRQYVTVIALIIGQGLTGSIISLLTLTSTLVGNRLAPVPYLVTLPITATVVGAAMMVYCASFLMNTYGRRSAFMMGSRIGLLGSILAGIAVYCQLFSLFVCSTFVLGAATVFNQYYRFAGAEIFDSEFKQKKCTSLIIGGGIIGGVLGPFIASKGVNLWPNQPFFGTFLIAGIVFILAWISQCFIDIPKRQVDFVNINGAGTLKVEIKIALRSPQFITGTLSCALGFSMMTLVMNATPLAMHYQHYNLQQSAFVLQWHFLAMYAPALFLPLLISRLSTTVIIRWGIFCFLVGTLSPFYWQDFSGYIFSLSAVGIGWSFMFTGGTFLINQIANPAIKHNIQGVNSLVIYSVNLIASLSVGFLMNMAYGWLMINGVVICTMLFFLIYMLLDKHRIGV